MVISDWGLGRGSVRTAAQRGLFLLELAAHELLHHLYFPFVSESCHWFVSFARCWFLIQTKAVRLPESGLNNENHQPSPSQAQGM